MVPAYEGEKEMKRLLQVLVLTIVAVSLVSCSGGKKPEPKPAAKPKVEAKAESKPQPAAEAKQQPAAEAQPVVQEEARQPTVGNVIIYTALDESVAGPILKDFEAQTRIAVEAVYATGESKAAELVGRLITAEEDGSSADVFWSDDVPQTITLRQNGLLEPYGSPHAAAISEQFKDQDGSWTGFAANARVFVYNTELAPEPPKTMLELTQPQWRGKVALARPTYGTTLTQTASFFAFWGPDKARKFLADMQANAITLASDNAGVLQRVVQGRIAVGLADLDTANETVQGASVAQWVLPDQGAEDMGVLLLPCTVSLLKNGPNPKQGKALIDYLLSPDTEMKLASIPRMHIPLNAAVRVPDNVPKISDIRVLPLPYEDIAKWQPETYHVLQTEFTGRGTVPSQ